MENTVIYSHERGFWSQSLGWVKYLQNADFSSHSGVVQLSFNRGHVVQRIKMSDCRHLTLLQTISLLLTICDANRTKNNPLKGALIHLLPRFHFRSKTTKLAWISSCLVGFSTTKNNIKTVAYLIDMHSLFYCERGISPDHLFLIPKNKSEDYEVAPIIQRGNNI